MKLLIVIFSALTAIALGSSWGVNRTLAGMLALPEGEQAEIPEVAAPIKGPSAPEAPAVARAGTSKREYIQGILGRNLFDHTAIGQTAQVRESGEFAFSDLDVQILATVVALPARYSSALLVFSGITRGYGVGDRIGDAEITEIQKMRLLVKRADGRIEVIDATGEKPKTTGDADAVAEGPAAGGDEGIEAVSETEFNIDRDLVEKYMNDLTAIQQLGRARVHRKDGEIDGYRLAGIRRDSVAWKLGIRNGDVFHSVNGASLTSMGEAMTAMQGLQSQSNFSFEITRKGQPTKLQYNIK